MYFRQIPRVRKQRLKCVKLTYLWEEEKVLPNKLPRYSLKVNNIAKVRSVEVDETRNNNGT